MSNFLAIATVTETLRRILEPTVSVVGGATVKTIRPNGAGNGTPNVGVSIYLYQVTPNATWHNADLPTRSSGGQVVQRPRVAWILTTC